MRRRRFETPASMWISAAAPFVAAAILMLIGAFA